MADEENAPVATEGAKPPKQSNMKLLIVIVGATLIGNAGGAYLSSYWVGKALARLPLSAAAEVSPEEEERKKQEEMAEAIENGAVVPLEPFVVNLADQDSPRYLRIKISLMVDDKTRVKEVAENQALTLKVRDLILPILTRKTSRDLTNEEGKNQLRHEIQEQVGVYFKEPKLMDVMFTEFVIQL